jgi:hypothetical protein
MGRINRVLSFLRITKNEANQSELKLDPGAGANVTASYFAPVGDDSVPLATDYALTTDTPQTGGVATVGFADTVSEPVAVAGETRRYSRDAEGATVAQNHLKADGSVVTSNEGGSITLLADGTIKLTSNENASITLLADGAIKLTTPGGDNILNADGSVTFSNGASLTATGDFISALGISLDTHTHIGNMGLPPSTPTP